MTNATAQQYGTGMSQSGSDVYGTLMWPRWIEGTRPSWSFRHDQARSGHVYRRSEWLCDNHRVSSSVLETWKDSNGDNVELSAGYNFGWSRPNGSIILTNNSLFDPAVEFQENWTRMQKRPN
jgi:hypothetical protein